MSVTYAGSAPASQGAEKMRHCWGYIFHWVLVIIIISQNHSWPLFCAADVGTRQWCLWGDESPVWSRKTSATFPAKSWWLRRRWKTLSRQWRTSARQSRLPTSRNTTNGWPNLALRYELWCCDLPLLCSLTFSPTLHHLDQTIMSALRSQSIWFTLLTDGCSCYIHTYMKFITRCTVEDGSNQRRGLLLGGGV